MPARDRILARGDDLPLFKRKGHDDDPVDPNERSPQLGMRYKDLQVLGALMDGGAVLSRPRHAVYYLYFGTSELAEEGAAQARSAGYTCEVREPHSHAVADRGLRLGVAICAWDAR